MTDVRIKLSSRPEKTPKPPRMNYLHDEAHAKSFNDILGELWEEEPTLSDHNSVEGSVSGKTVYTDGSGSRGKCSKTTPAGWGWCYQEEDQWIEAFGPVVTDPDNLHFRGAQVGSNNTGELTAILEALIMAIDHNWRDVTIRTDSQWSINVITRKWKARSHKTLVNYIKSIIRSASIKVRLSWIKAHAGHEGNERADKLAEEGKQSLGRFGASSMPPELKRTELPRSFKVDPVSGLLEASRQVFSPKEVRPKRPWITQATLEALAKARKAEADQDHNAKSLRNAAKRSAKRDRVNWIHAQLLSDNSEYQRGMWQTARNQKRGFQGRKRHLVVDNRAVPWSKVHEAFRDHLQNMQWKPQANPTAAAASLKQRHQLHKQLRDNRPFTIEDLQSAIIKLKKNKAPGPDEAPNELFLLLDDHNSVLLLQFYNKIWGAGEVPAAWKEAVVVSLYKGKGLDTNRHEPLKLPTHFFAQLHLQAFRCHATS